MTVPEDDQQEAQNPQDPQQGTTAPSPYDKAALKAQERRERRAEQEQRRQERRAERQQRHQERRETMRALAHRAEAWWQGRRTPKPEPTALERYRQRIESFDEDRETLPEKAVRYVFLALAYVLPFIVALAIGKEIGDAYAGTTDVWANGWSLGTHIVAYAGELALAMMVLSTAAAFRRYKADSSYTPKLLSSIVFFFVFVASSSLAQWFIAEQHIHPHTRADLAALIFRVTMPPAVDVASMLYLAIMGYQSLKKFLAEQHLKAEAITQLNAAEIRIQEAQQEAERRQKEAEQSLAMKDRREALLLRIEEIHSQAMIDTAQRALLPRGRASVRLEEIEGSEEGYRDIPMPGVTNHRYNSEGGSFRSER